MATNPYVNKVIYGGTTVMDISDSDVQEADVASGKVFYKGNGARSVGTGVSGDYVTESELRDTVGWTGKNLIHTSSATTTTSGVTFTVNRNAQGEVSSIDISGASGNADVYFNLKDKTSEYASGDYIFSDGVANANIGILAEGYNGSTWVTNFGGTSFTGEKSFTIDYSNYDSISLLIRVTANTTLSDTVTLYPMLRYADISDDTYEPYHESVDYVKANREEVKDVVGWSCKNLLPNNAITQTVNDVTFTVNSDGSVIADGTASATTNFTIFDGYTLTNNEDVILSGSPANGSLSTYKIGAWNYDKSQAINDWGEGVLIKDSSHFQVSVTIYNGYTANNLVFYPMLHKASIVDDTYEPYHKSVNEVAHLTTDTAETDIQDGDYFPFYDTSASGKRKSLWSNIKSVLKTYFDTVYQTILTFDNFPTASSNNPVKSGGIKTAINNTMITLTKAEYNALSSSEKEDPDKVYYVYDDTSDGNFYYLERPGITVTSIATAVRIPASGTDPNIHTTSKIVSIVSDSGAKWTSLTVNEGYVEVLVSKTFSNKAIGIYVDN